MTYANIQAAIDRAVMANGGKAFTAPGALAREGVRLALESLANACGVPEPREQGLSNEQLAMLYATARKDMAKAQRMAASLSETVPSGGKRLPASKRGNLNVLHDNHSPERDARSARGASLAARVRND